MHRLGRLLGAGLAVLAVAQTDNTTNVTTVTTTVTAEMHYRISVDPGTVWLVVMGVLAAWLLYRLGKAIL